DSLLRESAAFMIQALLSDHTAYVALGIMLVTFAGFAFERFPPEVVASAGAASFVALGLVTPQQAYSVFSNPAPLTIAALFVLTVSAKTRPFRRCSSRA